MDKEFSLPQEPVIPQVGQPLPPEHTLPRLTPPLPQEVLPPETALPGESAASASRKSAASKWKKLAYILVGSSALTFSMLAGSLTADVPDSGDGAPAVLPAQYQEYALTGQVQYTVYNDTFELSGQPLVLAEDTVDAAALAAEPVALPEPQEPEGGGYTFLGWVGRYKTSAGTVWTRLDDGLTAEAVARIKPDEDGTRTVVIHAAWRRTGENNYPWQLVLEGKKDTFLYNDVSVPMASGGGVYLCAYPEPTRPGYRFAGWLDDTGARVDVLRAEQFFAADGTDIDWTKPATVTLTAQWEKQ